MPEVLPNHAHAQMGRERLIAHPKLAQRVVLLSSLWREIDLQFDEVFTRIAAPQGQSGMALYVALNSATAHDAALNIIAEAGLTPLARWKLHALLADFRKLAGSREIVHSLWGISNDYPEALVVADPRKFSLWFSADNTDLTGRPQLLAYRERDLIAIQEGLVGFLRPLTAFAQKLSLPN